MRHNQTIFRLTVVSALFLMLTNLAYAQRKPRVAVLEFKGLEGRRVTDLTLVRLGESKAYTLLERMELDSVLKEISMNRGQLNLQDLFDPSKSVQMGNLQGVEILVNGKVDTYKVRKPFLSKLGGTIGVDYFNKFDATVRLFFRMVNASTGEVLETGDVTGVAKGSDVSGGVMSGGRGKKDEEFSQELLDQATRDAAGKLAVRLEQKAEGLQVVDAPAKSAKSAVTAGSSPVKPNPPTAPAPNPRLPAPAAPAAPAAPLAAATEGDVVDVSGNEISIKVEPTTGIQPGDRWQIRRVSKVITDPATGQELDRRYAPVGEVVITEVLNKTVVGKYSGTQPVQVGDKAIKSPAKAPASKGPVKSRTPIKKTDRAA